MRKLLIISIMGLVLFGASAAASMFLLPKPEETGEQETADSDPGMSQPGKTSLVSNEEIPIPFRPKGLTEESILELANTIREREDTIKERDHELDKRESRHKFILDDIEREKRELESVQKAVQDKIAEAQRLVAEIEEKRKGIVERQKEIEEGLAKIEKQQLPDAEAEQKNMKTLSGWLSAMPSDTSSQVIKKFCDDGKIDFAVEILANLEERDVAKILGPLDPPLIKQLAEGLRKWRARPQIAEGKKRKKRLR